MSEARLSHHLTYQHRDRSRVYQVPGCRKMFSNTGDLYCGVSDDTSHSMELNPTAINASGWSRDCTCLDMTVSASDDEEAIESQLRVMHDVLAKCLSTDHIDVCVFLHCFHNN
jgi:hypothetical protein